MNKRKVFGIGFLIVTLMILCTTLAYPVLARNLPKRPPFLPEARAFLYLMKLDLTARQKAEIARILVSRRDELKNVSRHLAHARLELFERVHSAHFDELSVRGTCKKIARTEEELAVARGLVVREVMMVLDSDQHQIVEKVLRSFTASATEKTDVFWRHFDAWIQQHAA